MKIAGLVAEFNPFHRGHEYIINKIKEDNVDLVIVAMSPNFVMRGEPAIYDKFERAKVALEHGVDIIAEIPTIYTIESADIYAYRSVEILDNLNVTDLYFGSEDTDESIFRQIVETYNSLEYKNRVNELLKEGLSFNTASKKTLIKINPSFEEILKKPNNILSIYYLIAIKKLNANIIPHFIKRVESGYFDEFDENKKIQSASAIRKEIELRKNWNFFTYFLNNPSIHVKKDYFNFIKYRIISMSKEELKNIMGVTEGLENKIKSLENAKTYDDLINGLVSKRTRETKANRILMAILLNIKKYENVPGTLSYIRILGFTNLGQNYLKSFRSSTVNITTTIKKNLPNEIYRELDFTRIYSLITMESIENNEYHPIIVD